MNFGVRKGQFVAQTVIESHAAIELIRVLRVHIQRISANARD